jgi:hypothetical protein
MKKLLCVLLTLCLLLTVVACEESANPASSGNTATTAATSEPTEPSATTAPSEPTEPTEPTAPTPEFTKLHAAFELFDGDTFSLEIEITEAGLPPIIVQRSGYSFYTDLMGVTTLIIDKALYELDYHEKTGEFLNLSDDEFYKQVEDYSDVTKMFVDLGEAKLLGTGNGEFMGEERFYEEFEHGDPFNRVVSRAFFNEEDELLGFSMPMVDSSEYAEVVFRVSTEIDEELFVLPEGFEITERER